MKNFFLQMLLVAGLGFLLQLFLPFSSVALAAALGGWLFGSSRVLLASAAGFCAASLLWGGYAFLLHERNGGILGEKMGEMLAVGSIGLLLLTAVAGGLLGGAGAMTGALARKAMQQRAG